jgi:hypothetical protein
VSLDRNPWPWPAELDGPTAAPDSHRVLLDEGDVRVLEVIVRAGHREPEHTHRHPSVVIVDRPARLRYYYEAQSGVDITPAPDETGPKAQLLAPEGPHSVKNVDDHDYHAFRIEYIELGSPSSR